MKLQSCLFFGNSSDHLPPLQSSLGEGLGKKQPTSRATGGLRDQKMLKKQKPSAPACCRCAGLRNLPWELQLLLRSLEQPEQMKGRLSGAPPCCFQLHSPDLEYSWGAGVLWLLLTVLLSHVCAASPLLTFSVTSPSIWPTAMFRLLTVALSPQ